MISSNKLFFFGLFGSVISLIVAFAAGALVSVYWGKFFGLASFAVLAKVGIFLTIIIGKKKMLPIN